MINWFFKPFSFKELKIALVIIGLGLIPPAICLMLIEIFVNPKTFLKEMACAEIKPFYSIDLLIYYLISGLSHIILCSLVANYFSQIAKRDSSNLKVRVLIRFRNIMILTLSGLVFLIDKCQFSLSQLSHDSLYVILKKAEYFRPFFKFFPSDILGISGEWFLLISIFPFFLICCALAVMVTGSLNISREVRKFEIQDLNFDNINQSLKETTEELKSSIHLLSSVLVSSTISTILFFQLPTPLISDSNLSAVYSNISISVGVAWGVIFSLTLVFLCIYPYFKIQSRIMKHIKLNRISGLSEIENMLNKYKHSYSLAANIKTIFSILSPLITSVLISVIT